MSTLTGILLIFDYLYRSLDQLRYLLHPDAYGLLAKLKASTVRTDVGTQNSQRDLFSQSQYVFYQHDPLAHPVSAWVLLLLSQTAVTFSLFRVSGAGLLKEALMRSGYSDAG